MKYNVFVPIVLSGMHREFKVELTYNGPMDEEGVRLVRAKASEHVASKGLELVEDEDPKIYKAK